MYTTQKAWDVPKKYQFSKMVTRIVPNRSHTFFRTGFLEKTSEKSHLNASTKEYVGVFIIRGYGTYIDWRGMQYDLFPGCYFQRIPGRKHSNIVFDHEEKWLECFVCINDNFYNLLKEYRSIDPDKAVLQPGCHTSLVETIYDIHNDLAVASEEHLSSFIHRFQEVIYTINYLDSHRNRDSDDVLVMQACQLLKTDLHEKIQLPSIADELQVSYSKLRKTFYNKMRCSPGRYRIEKRIEKAQEYLASKSISIKEIAFKLGYDDVTTFTKQFKKFCGVSPRTFQKVH